jgi:hypothetical protein
VPVTYAVCDRGCVCIHVRTPDAHANSHLGVSVRFEVDEVESTAHWSMVVGWGVLEKAEVEPSGARYQMRFTELRGFYRGAGSTV